MKKVAVFSFNSNPDYSVYAPLCAWAWEKLGWEVKAFYHNGGFHPREQEKGLLDLITDTYPILIHHLKSVPGYRSDTLSQISRLYGACYQSPEDYIMTTDVDLIPLSDYWKPNENNITVWGFDLTDYTEIPIGYIGMKAGKWREVMGLSSDSYNSLIKRDLESIPNAHESVEWEKRWSVDQQLITERLRATTFQIDHVKRGKYPNGYAVGRVDRGSWNLDGHEQYIDAHLLRDIYKQSDTGIGNLSKTMRLLYKIWPNEDFSWFRNYIIEFQKIANNG